MVVSAPAGSGKTVLLQSWIREAGLRESTGWVAVGRDERDPQHFWLSVAGALRRTTPGSALVQALSAAPGIWSWHAAGTGTRWPPSGPPSGWRLDAPHVVVPRARALQVFASVRLGGTERAEQALAGMEEPERERGDVRVATAALLLARNDPGAATAALGPVLDGSAPYVWLTWLIQTFLVRRSAGAHSVTSTQQTGLCGGRWIWPSSAAGCCPSCCIPRRARAVLPAYQLDHAARTGPTARSGAAQGSGGRGRPRPSRRRDGWHARSCRSRSLRCHRGGRR